MDTIEMPSYLGYRYILRVVDHLSNYGFVGKVKLRNSVEIGDELVRILSSSMIPDVLQSDNGREVSLLLNFVADFLKTMNYFWYRSFILNMLEHFWFMCYLLFIIVTNIDLCSS